jgi:tetratricopeptide (TPR) repeat protein
MLSLFAKEANIALPAAVLVLVVARGKLRASAASVTTLLAGTIAYFPLRKLLMQSASLPMAQGKALVRAMVDLPGVVLAYATSFLSPFSLSPDRHLWPPFVPLGWAVLALLATGVFVAIRYTRQVDRSNLGLAAGALVAFGLLLLPAALGFRSIGALSDRYVFFPLFFLAVAFLAAARMAARFLVHLPRAVRLGPIFVGCGVFLVATWLQVGVWKDEETLARHAVALDPDNSAALYRLATVSTAKGDFVEALPLLERAVALDPTHRRALGNLSVVYLNLNRVADAKSVLRRLLPLAGATDRKFWYNVASVQLADGKPDKACAALTRALSIDPEYALARGLRDQLCHKSPIVHQE